MVFPKVLSLLTSLALLFLTDRASADEKSLHAAYEEAERLEHTRGLSEALNAAEQGAAAAKASGDLHWDLKFRLKQVEILDGQSQIEDAAKLLRSIEPQTMRDPDLRALLALEKGIICRDRGREKCAVENFLISEANAASTPALLPTIEMRLGNAYLKQNQMNLAEQCYKKAVNLITAESDSYTRLSAQGAFGFYLTKQQRYDEAIQVFQHGLDQEKDNASPILKATFLLNLADSYSEVGDSERAAPLLDQASDILEKFPWPRGMQIALTNHGESAIERGDLKAAEDLFNRAAELARSAQNNLWLAQSLAGLATVALQRKDLPSANRFQSQVAQLVEKGKIIDSDLLLRSDLNQARISQGLGDLAGAQKLFQSAAHMGAVDLRLALEAQARLAQLLDRSGKPAEAEAAFRTALLRFDASRSKLLRDESKMAYGSALNYLFQEYVEFLASHGRHAEAFELAESSRARLLLKYNALLPGSRVTQFQTLAARSKATLLSYWTGPQRSWLWVVTPSKITFYQLPSEDNLRTLTARYRDEIDTQRNPTESEGSAGWELSAALLDPVRDTLAKGAHVIVVPDGSLFNINLASLPVSRTSPHYFIEDAQVTVVASLSLLLHADPTPAKQSFRVLAIGDVISPDKTRYPDLPNAPTEIQSLTTLFPGAVIRIRSEAVPRAYLNANPAQYSIIHFATHAESNGLVPLDSAVILSRHGDQFKLYARDIQKTRINADLVTVSSCRSAGSRTYEGEGLVGFAWAFLAAGARNVVAGLWDVDDRSTAELVNGMYKSLRRGNRPSQALREAQLALVRSSGSYRKPYYWAPFEVFANRVD